MLEFYDEETLENGETRVVVRFPKQLAPVKFAVLPLVKKDEKQAVKWFRMSADQGNAVAQLVLGNCYYHGWGVKKNTAEAVKWYRKAAEQGNAPAKEALKRLGVK